MSSKRFGVRKLVLLPLLAGLCGGAAWSPVSDWLRRLAEGADPAANIFLNQQRAEALRSRLGEEREPVQQMILRVKLAWELLWAGRSREAIDQAAEIQERTRDWPMPADSPVSQSLQELLALAHLRLGEQENCLTTHSPDACLLPIQEGGIHQRRQGSQTAVGHLSRLLDQNPEHLGYRWLFNLAHMTLGDYPNGVPAKWRIPPRVFESEAPLPRYPNIAHHLGLDLKGLAGGSILEDFDRDGHLDLVASSWGLRDPLRYFHNNRDGTFSEWTGRAGLDRQWGGLNILQADYDNDGYPDVLILRGGWLGYLSPALGNHPNSLLRNRGDGTFEDVTEAAGLLNFHPTQTAAWADFDLDGRLDLFVGNESSAGDRHPCQLFRNTGSGRFLEVAEQVGLQHAGFVKGAAWGDYDDDGDPDLYLSQFGASNKLYRNDLQENGRRVFRDVTRRAGVAQPQLSFPTWFWDYDNDGHEDLLVASFTSYSGDELEPIVADLLRRAGIPLPKSKRSLAAEHSRLYRNRGDGSFEDVTRQAGFDSALMVMGANFGDLDNDGFLDAYFGTGQPRLSTLIPNRMFRNDRGRRLQDVTSNGGFGHLQKGHGISFGDLDNDGDQDVYAVLGGAYSGDLAPNALFLNPGNSHSWVTLRLEGRQANRLALGARVRIRVREPSGLRQIHRTVSSGGSFGASSLQLEIGLGRATSIESLEIRWPDAAGTVQRWERLAANRVYRIRQGEEPAVVDAAGIRLIPAGSFQ